MSLPRLETALPELVQFTQQLSADYQRGAVSGWPAFRERALAFYTPAMMDKIERVVPGWGRMASFADYQTLIHVTSVLCTLWLNPDYQQANPDQQAIMAWMVMFHDIAKEPRYPLHDYIHGFRGAAMTGRALAHIGFPATPTYATHIDAWVKVTHNAIESYADDYRQDNRQLPIILAGLKRMYGDATPATWIVKGVLLHVSLPTDPDYPTVAPLTDSEIDQYLDADFFPLMRMMMLVDTDSWNIFDPDVSRIQHQRAVAFFERVRAGRKLII